MPATHMARKRTPPPLALSPASRRRTPEWTASGLCGPRRPRKAPRPADRWSAREAQGAPKAREPSAASGWASEQHASSAISRRPTQRPAR